MSDVLQIVNVTKQYSGLRPLRMKSLTLAAADRVSIAGLDAAGAELFVNLVTGAALPDSGEVVVFGEPTHAIADGDQWLASLERFGLVSDRAVMLEGATLEQNLAMPFTLEIDPIPAAEASRIRDLSRACGIAPEWLAQLAGELPGEIRARAHLARAIALGPRLLVMEHPTANVAERHRAALAADIVRVCEERALPAIVLTNDDAFARMVAPKNLKLDGATGEMRALKRGWFS